MEAFFHNANLFNFFFKSFAIVLSIIYLIYTIVIFRQTQVMLKTVTVNNGGIILLISFIQILLAILLIVLAFGII